MLLFQADNVIIPVAQIIQLVSLININLLKKGHLMRLVREPVIKNIFESEKICSEQVLYGSTPLYFSFFLLFAG